MPRLGGGGCLTGGCRAGREETESIVGVVGAKQGSRWSPAPEGSPACGFVREAQQTQHWLLKSLKCSTR